MPLINRQLNWTRVQHIMQEILNPKEQELMLRYYGLSEGKRDLRSLTKLSALGVKRTKEEILRLEKKLYLELKKRRLEDLLECLQGDAPEEEPSGEDR